METVEHILPKHKIGDVFFIPSTTTENASHPCPDCLGEKLLKVTSPAGDDFTLDCPRCGDGHYSLRDVPSLRYHVAKPTVRRCVITGYSVNEWDSRPGVSYKSSGHSVNEADMITDEAVALEKAQALADAQNARNEATPERIKQAHFGNLPLKEAALDQFKNGLYDAWAAFRHLREGVDELLEDENEHLSAGEIRDRLRETVETTMRYDFVFKGFTRVMETLVKLVNTEGEDQAGILAVLRERFKALPVEAQQVWTPTHPKSRWLGEEIPTF